jgi:Protein of unknown function (DUF3048) N-terminal domain/Protein of unknown function (DUF3048) C-terminal domain
VLQSARRWLSAVLAAFLLVALAACAAPAGHRAGRAAVSSSATPTPTPEPEPVFWPLTGRRADALVPRPALAVKIENSVDARPQTGLNAADMVWEEVVEGGITRFVAVYHSTLPPEIGPIRSVRPMDPAIAAPLHGLFAFSGGQQPFVDAVAGAGLQVLSHDRGAPGFYRTDGRRAPHNIYAGPQQFLAQADAGHRAGPPPQFVVAGPQEQPTALTAGAPTAAVRLGLTGLSHPQWTWSQPDAAWLRAEGGVPAVEANGSRLRATNVVVLRVDVVGTSFVDVNGTAVPETVLAGARGQALVASAGRTLAATWSKASATDPVVLTGPDDMPVRLAPGTTWVELVPNGSGAVATG